MARTLRTELVIQAYRNVKTGGDPLTELESLILRTLSKQHQQVYMLLRMGNKHTAREVADALPVNLNHASTMLKLLYDDGILIRRAALTDDGREFVYEVAF